MIPIFFSVHQTDIIFNRSLTNRSFHMTLIRIQIENISLSCFIPDMAFFSDSDDSIHRLMHDFP